MSNYIAYEDKIALHPGYYIEEIVIDSGLSEEEFAEKIEIDPQELIDIINGNQSISMDIAMKLSDILGTTPESWMNMQENYDREYAEIRLLQVKEYLEKKNYKKIKRFIVYDDMGRDEYHEVYDAGLKDGALLHRFKTSTGNEYSAIYQNGVEQVKSDLFQEDDIIKTWNEMMP